MISEIYSQEFWLMVYHFLFILNDYILVNVPEKCLQRVLLTYDIIREYVFQNHDFGHNKVI